MKKTILIILVVVVVLAGILTAVLYCDHDWQAASCTAPEVCSKCGRTQGELLPHTWLDATCVDPETCEVCGETQGEPLGHDWLEATCTDPETCTVCGETQGEALGHDWLEATCLEPEICSRCGESQGEALGHDFLEATCTDPETCSRCGETQGEALGHDWLDATCIDPQTCTRCGETQGELLEHTWRSATCKEPQTCDFCGATQGDVGDHTWRAASCESPKHCTVCGKTSGEKLGHTWKAATCEKPKTCTRCGATKGSALGHDFEKASNGKTKTCKTCGEKVKIKYVAITFDDGPSGSITETLLDGLAKRGAKATFFLCGYRIDTYGSLPQKILDGGHEIGLHTDNHATLTKLSAAKVRKELQDVLDMLPEGANVTLMRPPGGAFNSTTKSVCADMGLSIIMWSVDPRDWATSDSSQVVSRIVSQVSDGSIILLHDLKSSSVRAALNVIDRLQAQGYEFVTVSELAEIKGRDLEPGEVYYSLK